LDGRSTIRRNQMLTGELQKEKNGFQAAIPETPRSAARVKIKQARKRIAKIRAGNSKSSRYKD
jgi:hypothetical protein